MNSHNIGTRPAPVTTPAVDAAAEVLPAFNPGIRFYGAFISLSICILAAALDATSLSVALPVSIDSTKSSIIVPDFFVQIISQKLNGTAIEAFWCGTSFLLASTVFQPTFVSLSHSFGRKPMIIGALLLFTIGSISAGVAANFVVLLAGRTAQGIGGGGIISLTEVLITDLVPLRERGRWFGYQGGVWAIGSVSGPIIGGVFAERVSWRWIFW